MNELISQSTHNFRYELNNEGCYLISHPYKELTYDAQDGHSIARQ